MTQFKLDADLDDLELAGYGIYSNLEASRFCYALNNALNIEMVRAGKDYSSKIARQECFFLTFEYKDEHSELLWQLVKNKSKVEQKASGHEAGLFKNVEKTARWLSSKASFDYIFWIESEDSLKLWPQKVGEQLKRLSFIETLEPLSTNFNKLVLNKTQA